MDYAPSIKYFEPEQVEAILAKANSLRDKALLSVMYQCGLRRAEVQFLTRDDFNPARGMLRVTRLKKQNSFWHECALWRQTKRLLSQYLASRTDHHDALFLGQRGQAIGPERVYRLFRAAAEAAGITFGETDRRGRRHPSPHRLRHSIAVHQMNCGIPVEDIMEHLAHESMDTTLIYARVLTPRKKKNAMAMESSHHFAKF